MYRQKDGNRSYQMVKYYFILHVYSMKIFLGAAAITGEVLGCDYLGRDEYMFSRQERIYKFSPNDESLLYLELRVKEVQLFIVFVLDETWVASFIVFLIHPQLIIVSHLKYQMFDTSFQQATSNSKILLVYLQLIRFYINSSTKTRWIQISYILMVFDVEQFLVLDEIRKIMRISSQIILFILTFPIDLAFKIAEILAESTGTLYRPDHASDFKHVDLAIFILLIDGSHVLMLEQDE